jgi:hypothetical protein
MGKINTRSRLMRTTGKSFKSIFNGIELKVTSFVSGSVKFVVLLTFPISINKKDEKQMLRALRRKHKIDFEIDSVFQQVILF